MRIEGWVQCREKTVEYGDDTIELALMCFSFETNAKIYIVG